MTTASVSRETRLARYTALLRKWGETISLSSQAAMSVEAIQAHIDDSLELLPHLPDTDHVIDLGSGQGLPAIPLAVATGLPFTLVEADRRKAAFLTTVMADLALPGTVVARRIEAVTLPTTGCVMAQALARLERLLGWAKPLLQPGGVGLFPKGPTAAAEITAARETHAFDADIIPLRRMDSCLVKITRLG